MFISALFSCIHIPVSSFKILMYFLFMGIINLNSVMRKLDYFIMVKKVIIPGVLQKCRNVRRYKAFIFADTDNQRTFTSYRIYLIYMIRENNSEGKRALKFMHNLYYSIQRIAVIVIVKKLRHYFCIRFALECSSLCQQKILQRLVIFDNSVMNDSYSLSAVRVGVYIRRLAMCCPSCMTDSCVSLRTSGLFHFLLQICKASL